ncbi:hypothetical protein [Pimelobacter simplex]|uniref:hypothetical protein n=1 Tax=Nocardioides simplex TaxID=2045 RepID=UPI00214F67DC|nr:hypothetical protein [Pimelobacter simplex]UUW88453.1 hypothetical protein M0M43_22300 [Pimelobacter simplex]UUW97957.1 hypothetical protein M0M48_10945 [Pimelobacter simplex]
MTTIKIHEDERFPDYSVGSTFGAEIEATVEQIERWKRARAAYDEAQREMAELYEAARSVAREREEREEAERAAAARAEQERAAEERRRAEQERAEQRDAMLQRIAASDGVVYDAEGNRVGTVRDTGRGMTLEP